MASNLGTASITLTVNGQTFTASLDKKEKEVKGWASRVGGLFKKGIGGIGAGLGALAKGGIAGVGFAAATAGLDSLTGPIERIQDIAKQGDIASSLGLSVESFTSIAGAAKSAGSDTRDFLEGLITLSGKAMDAAAGKGEDAVQVFKDLGLNAVEFSKLDPEQQFYKLFEALNQVENPAKRVGLLLKAVGEDTGKNLTSMLGKSTDQLKELGGQFHISTADMAAAQVATQSLTKAKAQLGAATDKVVIAFAPAAEMLADRLPEAIKWCEKTFGDMGPTVITVLKGVAQAVGIVMDSWDAAKAGVQWFVGNVVTQFGVLMKAMAAVIKWADEMGKKLNIDLGWQQAGKDADDFANITGLAGLETMKEAEKMFASWGKNRREAEAWFDELMKKRDAKIADQQKKLQPGKFEAQGGGAKSVNMVEAAVEGSKEAAKIIGSWQFGHKQKDDIAKQQLAKAIDANKLLGDIKQAVQSSPFRFSVI